MIENLLFFAVLLLPLVGAALAYRLHKPLAMILANLTILGSFGLSVLLALPVLSGEIPALHFGLFEWFQIGNYSVDFAFLVDRLSAIMLLVVTGIGALIHLYSIGYMHSDPKAAKFFSYLNLFIFFMLLLILGDNLVLMFAGWEGVGFCSYLLISFWHTNLSYAAAGKKAFVMNRIGDAGVLIGIFAIFLATKSFEFTELAEYFAATSLNPENQLLLYIAAIGFFIGVTGKSAQLPLFTWLPDAMAGPTPVSALIHAATMVTAGIYLLFRLAGLYQLFPQIQYVIFVVALITSVLAALVAVTQSDIKKVLAYSTVSQLGLMVMACACGAYAVAIFHVVTHAFFKAGLFLAAGNIINACHHKQEFSDFGGLAKKLPLTAICYLVCAIAISGIYPLAGYFSKHQIEAAVFDFAPLSGSVLLIVFKLVLLLTAVYMSRSFVLMFLGKLLPENQTLHKNSFVMGLVVALLTLGAVVSGFILDPWLVGFLNETGTQAGHSTGIGQALLSSLPALLFFLFSGAFFAWSSTRGSSRVGELFLYLPRNKFFIDQVYGLLIVRPVYFIGRFTAGVVEEFTLNNTLRSAGALVSVGSFCLNGIQRVALLRGYLFTTIASVFLIILICFLTV